MNVYTFLSRLFTISIFFLFGCSAFQDSTNIITNETQNPDAKEIVTLDSRADIFQFDGVIYQTNIGWVDALTLTKGKQIGKIETQEDDPSIFENNTANKLPAGTIIYSPNEDVETGDVLLVELDGEVLKYFAIVEG